MSKSTSLQEPLSRDELREQIRETVRDAQEAAREGAREGGQVVVVPPRPSILTHTMVPPQDVIPPQVESISIAFFITVAAIIIGLPLMRAIARRIERGTPVAAPIAPEVRDQLRQISQSVDAIAIEVERISEGQRFTTKMLTDRKQGIGELSGGQ